MEKQEAIERFREEVCGQENCKQAMTVQQLGLYMPPPVKRAEIPKPDLTEQQARSVASSGAFRLGSAEPKADWKASAV